MAVPQRTDLAPHTPKRWSLSLTLRWVATVGAAVGAVLYSNWLLECVFTRTLLPDPDLYISEFAAADQPYGEWFRACDLGAAIVLLIATTAALIGVGGTPWTRRGWLALGAFAVATALDSTVWRLVCAPSSDAACAAREASNTVPIGHQLHWLSSGVVLVGAIASLLAFAVADRREFAPAGVRKLGLSMLGALVGTAIATGIAILIENAHVIGMVGVAQRAELAAFAGWLIYVAIRTARIRIDSGP